MSRSRVGRVVATSAALLLVGAGPALADDVSNNLDATVDATAEVMALNVGGPARTTTLSITTRNGDGKNGCNLIGDTKLVVSVSSSNTGVATVSPGSITFSSCGDTPTLTVTPVATGTSTISLSQTSNDSGGTFNLAPATFTANVAPPANTAPTVTVTGVTAGGSYEVGAVPAAACSVEDAEDSNEKADPTLSDITGPEAQYGLGSQTATCSYTDGGGLTATSSATYSIVDTRDPSIALQSRTPAANSHGWNKTDVTVTWSCSDSGSGVVTSTVTKTVSTEGADQSVTGTCTDHAGHTASATETGISIDRTAPGITIGRSPGANDAGWNSGDVTVAWTCSDTLSGVVDAGGSTVLGEGEDQSASATCTDKAGNSSSDSVVDVDVDETDPVLTLVGTAPTGWHDTDVTVEWTCQDGLSGVASADLTDTVSTEGDDGVASASCTDAAGNTATASVTGIKVDKTKPVLTLVGTAPTGWHNTDVTVGWTCEDTLAGVDQDASDLTDTVTTEGTDQTASATCVDRAGNEATDDVDGIDIDKTKPVITFHDRTPANDYEWNNGSVTLTWTCDDDLSGARDDEVTRTVSTQGADQWATGTCEDLAGNSSSDTQHGVNIDTTAPGISFTGQSPAANADGWNTGDVTLAWSCSDGLSGPVDGTVTRTVTGEGANLSATGTCVDKADNTASDTRAGIKIDRTAPTLDWVGPMTASSYVYGSVAPAPGCSASDALSGPAGPCTVSGYGTAVGEHTVVARVTDRAGNVSTVSHTYTVLSWTLTGYYAPVDITGILNTVKGGSTVPLKFEAFAGSREITATTELGATFGVKEISCSTSTPTDDIELTTTGGTSFRYDSTAGQFIQNWQTPKAAGKCYQVTTTTADGSKLTALFKLK